MTVVARLLTPRITAAACVVAALLAVSGLRVSAAEPTPPAANPATAQQIKFFESRIRPLLADNCLRCHGAEKQRGGLRLDTLASIVAGGESGPAIEPGRPEESLLVMAVNYDGLEMPPSGRLDPQQVADLTEWVRSGAPWPGSDGQAMPTVRSRKAEITDEDRQWWSFQPLADVQPPHSDDPWIRTSIDAFVLERLRQAGLTPAPPADRYTLIRRATFDLWGLPPTPERIIAFVEDERPDAYERLIDELLDHPNYGQRWARHWLDLVRYAESDGYKQDTYRPQAWRYRDYVIDSLNNDKPYALFVTEQLAGDEIVPGDPAAMTATAFLRHTIYEYNQRDVRTQWQFMVDELTDVTADVFLAMGLGCARCHDHKFDPLLQRDYYRLRAFFEPILPRDDLPLGAPEQVAAYQQQLAAWQEQTEPLRAEIDALLRPLRDKVTEAAIEKFPKDIRPMLRKAPAERSPLEAQLAALAGRQIVEEVNKVSGKLQGDDKRRYEKLTKQLAAAEPKPPAALPTAFCVTDVGPNAPPTFIPGQRDPQPIEPGFLTVLDPATVTIVSPAPSQTTGRRTALAQWITDPDNPLATRVIVNRIWQYHFGEGIVRTSSDFGRLGDLPSHPHLLDWLARTFIAEGGRLKAMHRLIMCSSVYRQATRHDKPELVQLLDADNRLLSHMTTRRLDAEQIRDAMLAASGELQPYHGGPSHDHDQPVRSIYTKILRNARDPLLEAFDAPDAFSSTSKRNVTTTPTQSLLMINSEMTLKRAQAMADSLLASSTSDTAARLHDAYWRTLGRAPQDTEIDAGLKFLADQQAAAAAAAAAAAHELVTGNASTADTPTADAAFERQAWIDLCHVLLNSSEFLYVD